MEENDVSRRRYELVIIGGSAGGLEAIIQILEEIKHCGLTIIIVLHRKWAVDSALVGILSSRSPLLVKEAEEKEILMPGTIYLAPADYHLLIEKDRSVSLDASEKINFSRPSIDVSFESAAEIYGPLAAAVLLSGGSSDGVEGLKKIKAMGGLCIVQDPGSALVEYMPRQAIDNVEVDHQMNAVEIGAFLNELR
ncbi:MAG: chemotaxis protein CheB [Flavitalea sp.]